METLLPFMAQVLQVWVCLIVIGRKISSKMEMGFHFGSHVSSFWQSNICHHCQTTIFLAFGLQKICLNYGSTLCIEGIRNNCFITFISNKAFQDDRFSQNYLKLIFKSFQNFNSLGQTSRKPNLFVLQRDYFAPDAEFSILFHPMFQLVVAEVVANEKFRALDSL